MPEINPNKLVFILSIIFFIIVSFTIGMTFNTVISNKAKADAPLGVVQQQVGGGPDSGGPYGCGDPGGISTGSTCGAPW